MVLNIKLSGINKKNTVVSVDNSPPYGRDYGLRIIVTMSIATISNPDMHVAAHATSLNFEIQLRMFSNFVIIMTSLYVFGIFQDLNTNLYHQVNCFCVSSCFLVFTTKIIYKYLYIKYG